MGEERKKERRRERGGILINVKEDMEVWGRREEQGELEEERIMIKKVKIRGEDRKIIGMYVNGVTERISFAEYHLHYISIVCPS